MQEHSDKKQSGRFAPKPRIPAHHQNGSRESPRRKSLSKTKIFVDMPVSKSVNLPPIPSPRDMMSSYKEKRPATYQKSLPDRYLNPDPSGTRNVVYEKIFSPRNKRMPRKAMIIGERPSLWKVGQYRRPQLPGNLFVDNLQHKPIDYRQYDKVTWNDILESHKQDVYMYRPRDFAQTLPQKEAWLSSIDTRVKYSKMNHQRELPFISPRIFNAKVAPPKQPQQTRYLSKDRTGNLYYLVGPSDVTKKEYRKYVFPEIVSRPPTPPKLNF